MHSALTLKLKKTLPVGAGLGSLVKKPPRYAGGGITSLMKKAATKTKGPHMPRYADAGSVSTQYVSNVPPGGEQAYADLIEAAQAATAKAVDMPEYPSERNAEFSDLQKQAYQGLAGLGPSGATQSASDLAQQATQRALGSNYNPNTFSTYGAGPQQVGTWGNQPQQVQGPGGPQQVGVGPGPQQVGTQSFTQPGAASAYMNPYMQNVVDIQKREATRADDIARTGRNAQAVGAGAFGGSRQAIVEAEAGRNLQQRLGDIQTQGSNAAFQQAQQQFNTEQGLGLQGQGMNQQAGLAYGQQGLQAALANQQAGLTTTQMGQQAQQANQNAGLQFGNQYLQAQQANQNAGLQFGNQYLEGQRLGEASRQFGANYGLQGLQAGMQGASTLGGLGNDFFSQQQKAIEAQRLGGTQQQENAQKILDTQYQDWQQQKNYPYQQLGFMSDILRGSQGSTRSMYENNPQPSNLQTLAGLGTALYGATMKAAGGSIDGGLASIAPDSVGDFADGGIVGYAEGLTIDDPQTAADREMYGRWWDNVKDVGERSGAAIADVGMLVPRGLAGAYDTAVVRPMRAAGLPAGYLSKHLMPEGGDPGSQTPFYDRFRTPDVQAAPSTQPPAKKDDAKTMPGITAEEAAAAGQRSGLFSLLKGSNISAGKAPTMDEMISNRKRAGTGLDTVREQGIASLKDIGSEEQAAADADAADVEARIAKRGVAGAEREKKLQGRLDEMGGRTERAKGDALIQAGLGILMADPRKGKWGAIASGLKGGFDQYRGDEEKLRLERAKLDDSMDALMEARRLEADADEKEKGAARKLARTAQVTAKKNMASFLNEVGLKEVASNDAMFSAYTKTYADWQGRDLTAQAHNASERTKLGIASLAYGGAGGGGKPMTPDQYNDNVRQLTDQLLKQGIGPDGKLYTQQSAGAEAKRQVDALRGGQSPYSLAPAGVRMTMTP